MSRLRLAGIAVSFLLLAALLFAGWLYRSIVHGTGPARSVDVIVAEGSTYRQTLSLFCKAGAIPSELPLIVLGRIEKVERSVKPGLYRVPAGAAPWEVFLLIRDGVTFTVPLIIPEGFTMEQIAASVEQAGLGRADEFLSLCRDPMFVARLGITAPSLEGFLFPDTYRFAPVNAPRDVIVAMTNRFRKVFDNPEIQKRLDESGLTMLQVVTLASIVEKEAKKDEERPMIAGVYLNRMKKRMRLEADPTILYGVRPLGPPILKSEIRRPTPYNTYVITGLPPGPIANPGEASIRAVLYPASTDALYFVANPDGSHQFSTTLEAHNRAVAERRRAAASIIRSTRRI